MWEPDKIKLLTIKATYRLHKQIAMKLQIALETNSLKGLPPETITMLLHQLGMEKDQWKSALKIARNWHLKRFISLIFSSYSPVLSEDSATILDYWVQSQIEGGSYLLLDDCNVCAEGLQNLSSMIEFNYDANEKKHFG